MLLFSASKRIVLRTSPKLTSVGRLVSILPPRPGAFKPPSSPARSRLISTNMDIKSAPFTDAVVVAMKALYATPRVPHVAQPR